LIAASSRPINAAAFAAALIALALAFPVAASAAPDRVLTTEIAGEGEGEVECKVGIGPIEPCEEEYEDQTTLTLVPIAEEGSKFAGWSDGVGSAAICPGKTGSCTITLEADSSVTANFETNEFTLWIELAGEGEGEVECNPGGDGEPEPELCADEYVAGTKVALVPIAEEGSKFAGWSDGVGSAAICPGKTGSCTIAIEADSSVTAAFEFKEYALKVKAVHLGGGTGSWECEREEGPEPCAAKYPYGSEVIVLAKADPGSEFVGWEGECHKVRGNECEVEMEAARTVSPVFAAIEAEAEEEEESGEEESGEEEEKGESPPSESPPASEPGSSSGAESGAPPALVRSAPAATRGAARAAGVAVVIGRRAAIRLRCAATGPCGGTLVLTAPGRRTRARPIGRRSFSLAPGAAATLEVELSGAAARMLRRAGALRAGATGAGVARSTVLLKPARPRHRHR
jgi:hypothetical protein